MLTFNQLQEKAESLPAYLNQKHSKSYTLSLFFCACIPSKTLQLQQDARLICEIAKNLDYYPALEEKKLQVLQGAYLYILEDYETQLKWLLHKPFLQILSAHIELNSEQSRLHPRYELCYQALDEFCNWVYLNRFHRGLGLLYQIFPPNMQIIIHQRYDTCLNQTDLNWSFNLTHISQSIKLNKLI